VAQGESPEFKPKYCKKKEKKEKKTSRFMRCGLGVKGQRVCLSSMRPWIQIPSTEKKIMRCHLQHFLLFLGCLNGDFIVSNRGKPRRGGGKAA
jgi:hypothetical protein